MLRFFLRAFDPHLALRPKLKPADNRSQVYPPIERHEYVGLSGDVVGIDTFGESTPADKLFDYFGFTVPNVVKRLIVNEKAGSVLIPIHVAPPYSRAE
jgi:hypothetical protein